MIGGATVVGANQAIQALQNTEIKVSLNGEIQTFKDETTGETQYPITYHDRTYLPLRNVAQLSGLNVDYDSTTNTALLKGTNQGVSNTLNYYDMKYELISHVYGPYAKIVDENSSFNGMPTGTFIVDIDNNGTPEIIKFGNYPVGDADFQLYTMNNNEVITTSHKFNLLNNVFVIYVTKNGVYAYENLSDGHIDDKCIYRLELLGTNLSRNEIIRHTIEIGQDGKTINNEVFYVNENKVDKNTYNRKIDELNEIKVTQKKVFREEADVGNLEYENLWVYEMYADAYCNQSIKVGKTYIFNEITADEISVFHNVLIGEEKIVEGEKIKILSENRQEINIEGDEGWFVDYKVQRENGDIVEIGQLAGRT